MKKFHFKLALTLLSMSLVFFICLQTTVESNEIDPEQAEILQTWQGDFPVAQLDVLPVKQRERAVGFIDNARVFTAVWKCFKPDENIPEIDFTENLVMFARNTHFYNRISIGRVDIVDGVAEVLAMETMTATAIEDKVGFSLAVVPRKNMKAVKVGDDILMLNSDE